MPENLSAGSIVRSLEKLRTPEQAEKYQRYFKTGPGEYAEGDSFLGVPMGEVFKLAKQHLDLPPAEIEKLMEAEAHEVRAAAMSVMDKQARRDSTPEDRRTELYGLYRRRHDRINNWDLVDLGAPHVVGRYLFERDRAPLYELASSEDMWERRTAIAATSFYIRNDQLDDTFRISEILIGDPEEIVTKCCGGWLRFAGDRDEPRLLDFLDEHAASMPRNMLRHSIEHLEPDQRTHYRSLKAK